MFVFFSFLSLRRVLCGAQNGFLYMYTDVVSSFLGLPNLFLIFQCSFFMRAWCPSVSTVCISHGIDVYYDTTVMESGVGAPVQKKKVDSSDSSVLRYRGNQWICVV